MKLLLEWLRLTVIARMLRLTLSIRVRLGKIEVMLLGLDRVAQAELTGRLEKLSLSEKDGLRQVLQYLMSRGGIAKLRLKNQRRRRITLLKEKMVALKSLPKLLRVKLLRRTLKVLEKVESFLQRLLSL